MQIAFIQLFTAVVLASYAADDAVHRQWGWFIFAAFICLGLFANAGRILGNIIIGDKHHG